MKYLILLIAVLLLPGCSHKMLRYHGKEYRIIQAGDRYWMGENLATSSYRNGKKIPLVNDTEKWPELYSPACGFYRSDSTMLVKYGMLYNWYAVDAGKLCPAGWRVATHEDWTMLEDSMGGQLYAGGRIKSAKGWSGKHVSGDDLGFTALPAGYRLNDDFLEGKAAVWWTSTKAANDWV